MTLCTYDVGDVNTKLWSMLFYFLKYFIDIVLSAFCTLYFCAQVSCVYSSNETVPVQSHYLHIIK